MRRPVRGHSPLPDDPLERARRYADDARDIASDQRRQLPDYDADVDEVTARTELHVHMHSSHEIEAHEEPTELTKHVPAKWRPLVGGVIAVGAAVIGVVSMLQSCKH